MAEDVVSGGSGGSGAAAPAAAAATASASAIVRFGALFESMTS